MVKLYIAFWVISMILCVFCVIDILRTKEEDTRYLHKLVWLVFVLIFPFVGSVAWLAVGSPRNARPSQHERPMPSFPEYDRPGRAAASTPEADEDFLRRVRERAEEQRKKHEADKKRQAEEESS